MTNTLRCAVEHEKNYKKSMILNMAQKKLFISCNKNREYLNKICSATTRTLVAALINQVTIIDDCMYIFRAYIYYIAI